MATQMSAKQYRERPTEEILQDQKLLERLKHRSTSAKAPRWEWIASEQRFVVSPEWVELTGYSKEQAFGSGDDEGKLAVPIEGLLDNLIEKFTNTIVDSDKARVKSALENFVTLSNRSGSIELAFCIRKPDNSIKAVNMTAYTLWQNGRLRNIYCTATDLGNKEILSAINLQRIHSLESAEASNRSAIQQIQRIQSEAIALNAKIKKYLKRGGFTIVTVLSVAAGFSESIEGVVDHAFKVANLWRSSAAIKVSDAAYEELPLGAEPKIEELLRLNSIAKARISLYAYEPGDVPKIIHPLIHIDRGAEEESREEIYLNKVLVDANKTIKARTDAHVVGSPFITAQNGIYEISYPIAIYKREKVVQRFFIVITATNPSEEEKNNMDETARILAARAKDIISLQRMMQATIKF